MAAVDDNLTFFLGVSVVALAFVRRRLTVLTAGGLQERFDQVSVVRVGHWVKTKDDDVRSTSLSFGRVPSC
jgi:hypothetical protein